MKVDAIRVAGIRSFEDTGVLDLSPHCNIFVGLNNSGKSTILRSLLALQGFPFTASDLRGTDPAFHQAFLSEIAPREYMRIRPDTGSKFDVLRLYSGSPTSRDGYSRAQIGDDSGMFASVRPNHAFIPFLARRKASGINQDITKSTQDQVTGTLSNLYSRVDLLANFGHPDHEAFRNAVESIIGLPITTQASGGGKEAGFYLSRDRFVTLDRAGDGVTEMVALIVELCLERNKVFVLEEPETNLHPKALKALLGMVRSSAEHNQFIIATHSNIVVRELGYDDCTKVFRVYRPDPDFRSPSHVEEVARTSTARITVLRELGYEFGDLELYDAWLMLEESSAEQVMNEVLIPWFVPELTGRLRTYSAAGVSNVEPAVAEFQRLVTFVHLQPVYQDRLWVRTDGDEVGKTAAETVRAKFHLTEAACASFSNAAFEQYYPAHFSDRAKDVLAIANRKDKRSAKAALLSDVLTWSRENSEEAKKQWGDSAKEPIELLAQIAQSMG